MQSMLRKKLLAERMLNAILVVDVSESPREAVLMLFVVPAILHLA